MEKEAATNPNFQTGLMFLLIIMGLAAKQILSKLIDKFFKKTIDAEYVTVVSCQQHRQQINIDVDSKFTEHRRETNEFFSKINDNIEKLNGLVIIGIMQNKDIPEDQKKEAVISLTTHRNQK